MQQAYRIVLIGLMALTQLFAPLVHAHARGADFSGLIHLPGLEFLANADAGTTQSFTHRPCLDVIVGLSPGLKGKNGHAVPLADFALDLPPSLSLPAVPPRQVASPSLAHLPSPAKPNRLVPSPRAPPKLG